MSRIGRMPIAIPAGVTVEVAENNKVTVKGPKGTLERVLPAEMEIKVEDGHPDLCPDVDRWFYRILQLLRMGNLPCMEQCDQLRNHDHVFVSFRNTDKLRKLPHEPDSFRDFSHDLCRTSDGYRGNAAGRLQSG